MSIPGKQVMSPIKKLSTGHTIEEISEEDFQRLNKHFPMCDGYAKLYPGGWFVSTALPPILEKIYNFGFRPTDTLVVTYPKSGTTWMMEIVWTLQYNPDLDNPRAALSTEIRAPQMEIDMNLASKNIPPPPKGNTIVQYLEEFAPDKVNDQYKMFALVELLEDPRVIKTHLPLELFKPSMIETCKVIYVARDPRDVIVSKFHYYRIMLPFSFKGTLDEFIDYFINEEQYSHPFWSFVKQAYDLRDHPNLLFLYFEDMKADPLSAVTKISEFLGLKRTPQQIQNVVEYTSFKNMKKRIDEGTVQSGMTGDGKFLLDIPEAKIGLFRKGISGDWKNKFNDEQVKKITAWMEKNMEMFPDDFKYKNM